MNVWIIKTELLWVFGVGPFIAAALSTTLYTAPTSNCKPAQQRRAHCSEDVASRPENSRETVRLYQCSGPTRQTGLYGCNASIEPPIGTIYLFLEQNWHILKTYSSIGQNIRE